jgi:hypothetical protein
VKGKDRFTAAQADRIRSLLMQRATAERPQQTRLRGELRATGFYISDWSGPGFTPSDFDGLVTAGRITIGEERPATMPEQSEPDRRQKRARAAGAGSARDRLPHNIAVTLARKSLSGPRHALDQAKPHVPAGPGLYAIYGPADAWRELGLGDPPDDRPLYVGKAEDSLVSRDVKTHFGSGRTGSSTVRRSFAALLRGALELRAQPRNPSKPERFANYGLAADGDERLTRWMRSHLSLAVWPKPVGVELIDVERELLRAWEPPLNLKDVHTPWSGPLSDARKAMADEARIWARGR